MTQTIESELVKIKLGEPTHFGSLTILPSFENGARLAEPDYILLDDANLPIRGSAGVRLFERRNHFIKFIVAALSFMLVVPCALAQQPIAGTNMSRWREYQEKLNQSREERELRSRGTFPVIPAEETISVARLRHAPPAKALKALQHGLKLDRAGDSAGSAEAFRQAVALDPDYSEAHTNLGAEYINLGQIDDAITEFRSASVRRITRLRTPAFTWARQLRLTAYSQSKTVATRLPVVPVPVLWRLATMAPGNAHRQARQAPTPMMPPVITTARVRTWKRTITSAGLS